MGRRGRKPLPPDIVGEVVRLVELGWSDRRIARRLRISHTSVMNIRRPPTPANHRTVVVGDELDVSAAPRRCPVCGMRLDVIPCRRCELPEYLAALEARLEHLFDGSRSQRRRDLADLEFVREVARQRKLFDA